MDDCNGAQKTGRKLGRKESSVSSKESTVSSADSALGWGREPSPEVVRRARVSRPSCVAAEVLDREALGEDGVAHREESVLGMIHLDLARYHESCRCHMATPLTSPSGSTRLSTTWPQVSSTCGPPLTVATCKVENTLQLPITNSPYSLGGHLSNLHWQTK